MSFVLHDLGMKWPVLEELCLNKNEKKKKAFACKLERMGCTLNLLSGMEDGMVFWTWMFGNYLNFIRIHPDQKVGGLVAYVLNYCTFLGKLLPVDLLKFLLNRISTVSMKCAKLIYLKCQKARSCPSWQLDGLKIVYFIFTNYLFDRFNFYLLVWYLEYIIAY